MSFTKQVLDFKRTEKLGARALKTSAVHYLLGWEKKSIFQEYNLTISSTGLWLKDEKGVKHKLRKPMFGFQQQWLKGTRLSLKCSKYHIPQLLIAAGKSGTDWNHFKQVAIQEFVLLESVFQKLKAL